MRVPAVIYASEALVRDMDHKVYEQAVNVATLPGIVTASYAMPDAHWGYGFPIGGVAAFDPDADGVVSAGGVGFDISCGVRCLHTGLRRGDVMAVQKALAEALFHAIPAGVGSTGSIRLDDREMDAMLAGGARWAVERGWGRAEDLERIEEHGQMGGAQPEQRLGAREEAPARRDGHARLRQSLPRGAGGHRGLRRGHRNAASASRRATSWSSSTAARAASATRSAPSSSSAWRSTAAQHGIVLPDRELACAPIRSTVGQDYLGAMRAAINCALANRQILTHLVREVFARRPAAGAAAAALRRLAQHLQGRDARVDGGTRKLYVHRKGATRAFGPGPSGPARGAARRRPAGADRRLDGHRLLRARRARANRRRRPSARPATARAAR